MRPAALYLRVSTDQQTTMNQERELRTAAARMGCEIVAVYTDQGISVSVSHGAPRMTEEKRERRAHALGRRGHSVLPFDNCYTSG
jgi:DNA invertase Pin-like site-specific DNA recombinase